MKAKEFIPASKPRNFVAKNAPTSGAGRHKDSSKKKDLEHGKVKHKGKQFAEGVEDYADIYSPEAVALAKKFIDQYDITDDGDIQLTVEIIDLYLEDFKEKNQPVDLKFIKSKLASTFRQVYRGMGGGPSFKKSFKEQGMDERIRDPEDWDEGNTEPPNNFAVYINGKKWKVFKGRGQFADDYKEIQHYRQLRTWAEKKSAETGKKWTVSVTGEQATESVKEGESARDRWNKASDEREKKHADIEKEMKARHASGKEDMKGAIDRLEKHLNNK
jgi:hypothetical protein